MYGAYDDNVYADQRWHRLDGSACGKAGWFGGLETGLNYTRHTDVLSFGAEGGVGLTTYTEDEPLFTTYPRRGELQCAASPVTAASQSRKSSSTRRTTVSGLFIEPDRPRTFDDPFVMA